MAIKGNCRRLGRKYGQLLQEKGQLQPAAMTSKLGDRELDQGQVLPAKGNFHGSFMKNFLNITSRGNMLCVLTKLDGPSSQWSFMPWPVSCHQLTPTDVQWCNSHLPCVLGYPVHVDTVYTASWENILHCESLSMNAQDKPSIVRAAHLQVLSQISAAEMLENWFSRIWASEQDMDFSSSSTALLVLRAPRIPLEQPHSLHCDFQGLASIT